MVFIPEMGKDELAVPPAAGVTDAEASKVPTDDFPDLSNVMGEASASPVTETDTDEDSGRDRKEFFNNLVISEADVGKTLLKKIEEAEVSADDVTRLSETEDRYLNDLLFRGYVSHLIYLKEEFPITLRSASPVIAQRAFDLIVGENGSKVKMSSIETCMMVAIYLESYGVPGKGGLYFSHKSKSCEDFSSEAAVKERFEFIRDKLSSIVVDVILSRLKEFLSLLNRISLSRNIINF